MPVRHFVTESAQSTVVSPTTEVLERCSRGTKWWRIGYMYRSYIAGCGVQCAVSQYVLTGPKTALSLSFWAGVFRSSGRLARQHTNLQRSETVTTLHLLL